MRDFTGYEGTDRINRGLMLPFIQICVAGPDIIYDYVKDLKENNMWSLYYNIRINRINKNTYIMCK